MQDKTLYRIDPLTGCFNLLGFLEWLTGAARRESAACSLLSLDVNHFAEYNAARGHAEGDAALRWVALVVTDETSAPIYRTGGDEFVVVLEDDAISAHQALAQRLYDHLNQEAERVGLTSPAVAVTLVHYPAGPVYTPAQVMGLQQASMQDAKHLPGRPPRDYWAPQMKLPQDISTLLDGIINRMVDLGRVLNEVQALAYSDPLTGLPNVRAATLRLQTAGNGLLAVLMLDGDNLRLYNDLGGYAAGDRMIQDLSAALQAQLRPDDFLARWRMGDEFLALLTGVDLVGAMSVGQRLCQAVRHASTAWLRPVTVSVGVAVRPDHGLSTAALLAAAEQAKDRAKASGKDRVVAAEPWLE